MPCVVCNKEPTDNCHIQSKGAGGELSPSNIMQMCREHHTEQHRLGWFRFAKKHYGVAKKLSSMGWGFNHNNRPIRR